MYGAKRQIKQYSSPEYSNLEVDSSCSYYQVYAEHEIGALNDNVTLTCV